MMGVSWESSYCLISVPMPTALSHSEMNCADGGPVSFGRLKSLSLSSLPSLSTVPSPFVSFQPASASSAFALAGS